MRQFLLGLAIVTAALLLNACRTVYLEEITPPGDPIETQSEPNR